MDKVVIRRLNTLQDFKNATDVQQLSWGMSDRDILPSHFMIAFQNAGEQWGAFCDNKMIGMALCYPINGKLFILHMMATIPEYRGKGVGKLLLNAVISSLKERNQTALYWTYDPLDPVNAGFYHNHFGAIGYQVKMDYYGRIASSHHASLPTHRLFCILPLVSSIEMVQTDKVTQLSVPITLEEAKKDPKFDVSISDNFFQALSDKINLGYVVSKINRANATIFLSQLSPEGSKFLKQLGL